MKFVISLESHATIAEIDALSMSLGEVAKSHDHIIASYNVYLEDEE